MLLALIGLGAERWAVLWWDSVVLRVALEPVALGLPVVPELIVALEPLVVPELIAALELLAPELEPAVPELSVVRGLVVQGPAVQRLAVVTCQVGPPAAASQLRMVAAGEVEEAVGLRQQWLSILEITAER